MNRRLGAYKDKPDPRDLRMGTFMAPVSLPPVVSHRAAMNEIRDQGTRPSCVSFGVAAIKEWQEEKQRKFRTRNLDLSEEWLYEQVRQPGGGAYPRDAMKVLANSGVCIEKLLPYDYSVVSEDLEPAFAPGWRAKLNARFYKADGYAKLSSLSEIKQSLVINGPAVLGLDWQEPWSNADIDTPILPVISDRGSGGHLFALIGYSDVIGCFECRNSWGINYGDRGYFWLPYAALDAQEWWDAWASFDMASPKIDASAAKVMIEEAKAKAL